MKRLFKEIKVGSKISFKTYSSIGKLIVKSGIVVGIYDNEYVRVKTSKHEWSIFEDDIVKIVK